MRPGYKKGPESRAARGKGLETLDKGHRPFEAVGQGGSRSKARGSGARDPTKPPFNG